MKTDDENVTKILKNLNYKNIFINSDHSSDLHNISNGKIASEEITNYLLSLKENWEDYLQ